MSNILIIGNEGYVGSYLTQMLNKDYKVDGIDLCWFNNIYDSTIKADYNTISKEFLYDFDVVILLAGHSSVKMCEGDIIYPHNNNVNNFINLLSKIESIKEHKRIKFVYASSSSVYGNVSNEIHSEDSLLFKPINNYDCTKYIIDNYAQLSSVEYYGLRFGTINGFSPILRTDIMINSMLSNGFANGYIKLFLKEIFRPILGIQDLYKGIISIIEESEDKRGIYNMASFNMSAGEIANEVSRITGIPIIEEINPNNPSIYNFSINSEKFKKSFNFEFTQTVESIVESIMLQKGNFIETNRNEKKYYEM
jgi:UDP-glucuronate 4-epimerase